MAWRTPPRAYGPWETVVSLLAEGLTARGVEVTLFATLDSITSAKLDGVCTRPYNEDPSMDGRVWEALHTAHCLARSQEFDLVHNHLDWLPLAMSRFCACPMVTTIHGFGDPRILPAYAHGRSAFVSISDADRSPSLDYVATVHHGVDTAQWPATAAAPGQREDLVSFGRIHPDKATADAIEVARRSGRRLTVCGPVQDEPYFRERVEPHIDGDRVRYLGNVGGAARATVLGGSGVLLHPLGFDEPFGLSVVEAMMCGTPVVAYRRGAMPDGGRRWSDRLRSRRYRCGCGRGSRRARPRPVQPSRDRPAPILGRSHGRRASVGLSPTSGSAGRLQRPSLTCSACRRRGRAGTVRAPQASSAEQALGLIDDPSADQPARLPDDWFTRSIRASGH